MVLVKHLLYIEKYTIDGARQKVDEHRKKGQLKPSARRALDVHTLASIEQELAEVMNILGGDDAALVTDRRLRHPGVRCGLDASRPSRAGCARRCRTRC